MTGDRFRFHADLPRGRRLRVFVSSMMNELRDARAMVRQALQALHIDVFVFEKDAGARELGVVQTSLWEVEEADVLVALFDECLGEVTVKELARARELGKRRLIYLRSREQPRQRALDTFLKEQDATPDVFADAVDLGEKVQKDIMRLVVDGYRQSARDLPASALPPVVRLACDVADWYRVLPLGYSVEREPAYLNPGPAAPREAVDIELAVDSRPGMGQESEELLVRCIARQVNASDVDEFVKILEARRNRRGQIISDLEVTPAGRARAREAGRVVAQTFDELLDETVRFDQYLSWLEGEIRKHEIHSRYLTLGCAWQEADGRTQSRYGPGEGGIDKYIDLWMRDSRKEHVSILGEFGTGKTWTVLNTAWRALERYREATKLGLPRPRLPLVIPLRDYAKADSMDSLLASFFFNRHKIGLPSDLAFRQLNRMGKLLLLFDGFDEMSARIDRQRIVDHITEFAKVLVPGAKAILTCRTEHFPSDEEGRAVLSGKLQASSGLTGRSPQFEVVELEPLEREQIQTLLSRRAPPEVVTRVMENEDLVDLAHRPLMVELILEALDDLRPDTPVDPAHIYLYAVRRKMERDIKAERTFTSMADKLYFLCELSAEMIMTDRMKLNYREFPDRVRSLFGSAVQEQKELDHWNLDMMAQSLLIRSAEGDYSPAHRSLIEFFVAYRFVAKLGVLADSFAELARPRAFDDSTLPPRDYTWNQYFQRAHGEEGMVVRMAPLGRFATEDGQGKPEDPGPGSLVERLPRNAVAMAAAMVGKEPACLNRLCTLAWEATRTTAWNALSLLPLLKGQWAEALAMSLLESGGSSPLRNGVAWVLGELGVTRREVIEVLELTVTSVGRPEASVGAYWEAGFALEKLGRLRLGRGGRGSGAMKFLAENLPRRYSRRVALDSLEESLAASEPEGAWIDQCAVVAIVKHSRGLDAAALFRDVLSRVDFARDLFGRRCYYMVWLCGHLRIRESADAILRATRHPHSSVRNCACEALGKIGERSSAAIKALEACLTDRYYRTRFHAAWSLGQLDSVDSLPALLSVIKLEEVRDVRQQMIEVRDRLEQATRIR